MKGWLTVAITFLSVKAYLVNLFWLIFSLDKTFIAWSELSLIFSTRNTSPKDPFPRSSCAVKLWAPMYSLDSDFAPSVLFPSEIDK